MFLLWNRNEFSLLQYFALREAESQYSKGPKQTVPRQHTKLQSKCSMSWIILMSGSSRHDAM